ncbi:MAG TPA: nucleotidyltransferase domain-containing protein [Duganella sp.]|nr:nucleotidyltransferase domain-containing protein [Duganella sp.]
MIDSILEKAYPGLHRSESKEILSTPDAVNIASTYIRENYAECRCALLFGSYCRGEQKLFSDMDILIILPKFAPGRGPEMLRTIRDGVRVEVFLLTEKTFSVALAKESSVGLRIFYSAITQGITVGGAAGLADKLRHSAKLQFQDKRKISAVNSMGSMRVQITNQLFKLSCAKEHFDRVHCAAVVLNSICLAIIKFETGETLSFEHLPKKLREHDPAAAQTLECAYLKVCMNGDTNDFINSAGALLDRLGGPAWSGVSEPIRLGGPAWLRVFAPIMQVIKQISPKPR